MEEMIVVGMICPCKGCTFESGRSITCHDECEKYLEWREEYQKARKRYDEERRALNEEIYSYKKAYTQRKIRRHNNGKDS